MKKSRLSDYVDTDAAENPFGKGVTTSITSQIILLTKMATDLAAAIVEMSINAEIYQQKNKEFRIFRYPHQYSPQEDAEFLMLLTEGWRVFEKMPMSKKMTFEVGNHRGKVTEEREEWVEWGTKIILYRSLYTSKSKSRVMKKL